MTRQEDEKLLFALEIMEQIIEPDTYIDTVAAMCDVDVNDLKEAWESD